MRRREMLALVAMIVVGSVWNVVRAQALPAPTAAPAQTTQTAVAAAQTAERGWLQLIDDGRYREGWAAAAAFLRAAISEESFAKAVAGAREPLGAMQSRTLASATETRTLPGAPDGEYVVCVYDTRFANKAAARETVTASREKDGAWRVSGYYIK